MRRAVRARSGFSKIGRQCCRGSSKSSRTNTSACSSWAGSLARRRRFRRRQRRSRWCPMGKTTGFLEYTRELPVRRPVIERVNDWFEIYHDFPEDKVRAQGARCMDCGVPFCHTGCPLNNLIPDWNDLVFRGRWKDAIRTLHSTNNFPEFTGRLCPAPCEASCVLGINEPPVTIKQIEKTVVDRAFEAGWIEPEPAQYRTGKRVA